MRRSSRLFLAILVVAWVSPLTPGAAAAADPNELADLLKASGSPGTDAAKVEALLDVLRDAERRHAQQSATEKTGKTPLEKEAAGAAGASAPASGAVAAETPEGEEETDEDAEPKKVSRAGCMYSGTKLIWEKVPGSCGS